MHPNEALLRREYEARAARDARGLIQVFTNDVVWHIPGRSAIAGEYRGLDQVMGYVRTRRELAAGTFEIIVHDVLANDEHGLVIATGRATRDGETSEWRAHGFTASATDESPSAGCSPKTSTNSTVSGAEHTQYLALRGLPPRQPSDPRPRSARPATCSWSVCVQSP